MGMINRVFSFLIFGLAIAGAFFAFKLSEKRVELKGSKDALAKLVKTVATNLDEHSETAWGTKIKPRDINSVKDVKAAESIITKQAKEVIAQRDELSSRLKDISKTLDIPDFREEDFQNIDEYSEKAKALADAIEKVKERNDEIIKAIAKNGENLGVLVTEEQLNGDKYADALKKYNEKVNFYKTKHDHLVNYAKSVSEDLGLSSPSLNNDNYDAALQTAIEEIKNFKETADTTASDLKRVKNQFARTRSDLEKAQQNIESLEGRTKAQKKQLAKTKAELAETLKQIKRFTGGKGNIKDGIKGMKTQLEALDKYRKLKGKVVSVNKKWGFVVINLGQKNKYKDMTVPLPVNEKMIVARGLGDKNQFVANVKIAKVYPKCAVANILFDTKKGAIQVDDIVYFGEKEKEKVVERKVSAKVAPKKEAVEAKEVKKDDDTSSVKDEEDKDIDNDKENIKKDNNGDDDDDDGDLEDFEEEEV